MTTNLIDVLETIDQDVLARVALIHGECCITYRELDERSRAIGAFFQAAGVQPGQKALVLVPVGIEFYLLFLGLVRIGVTVMLIDPAVGQAQIAACCRLAAPDLLIGSPKAHLLRLLNGTIRRIPRKFALAPWVPGSTFVDYRNCRAICHPVETTADTPALITFTSGSTGAPKGICRTHGFLLQQHAVLCETIPAQAGDVEMNTLPVFILSSLARGLTVVIPKSFSGRPDAVNAAAVVEELRRHQVTRLLAAPAFCQRLVDELRATNQRMPTIVRLYTGGGPVFPSLSEALQERLPNAVITAVYGSTEAEPIAHINLSTLFPADQAAMAHGQGLPAGKPIDAIQIAILPDRVGQPIGPFTGEDFAAQQLPANCTGEIVVSGAHVQRGYLGGDDGLTKFQVDGTIWHRTGDAGYRDGFGRLWLLGRCTARIGAGATVQYPFAVEAAAMSHRGVERAAYVEVHGEGILAVQASRQQWPMVRQSLREALPTVRRIAQIAEIPVDTRHGSKVRYDALRAQLAHETLR